MRPFLHTCRSTHTQKREAELTGWGRWEFCPPENRHILKLRRKSPTSSGVHSHLPRSSMSTTLSPVGIYHRPGWTPNPRCPQASGAASLRLGFWAPTEHLHFFIPLCRDHVVPRICPGRAEMTRMSVGGGTGKLGQEASAGWLPFPSAKQVRRDGKEKGVFPTCGQRGSSY